ncbi:MAG: Asp-tRNA(Asn)/Glu-tRNA(Gln) amidotransferase subunit GatC, partial [Ignavibacteria bacterium]|jgi:aspartyl-tRNA(Asn)/glutamyl-tRNA(Gln) amidotransferase subunit C
MILSEKDIKHIASLARLELTDREVQQYRTELGGILRYVDQLQKVRLKKNISRVEKKLLNVLRSDVVVDWPQTEREQALHQAPDHQGRLLKVKRILN